MAKQSAAFDACLLLRKNNLLDDHFDSIYHKRLPAMRNAKLAITSKKTDRYSIRNKPDIWLSQQGSTPRRIYATVICFLPSSPLSRRLGSLILLTRDRLPNFPTFPVFLEDDVETTVYCLCINELLEVVPSTLELLTGFTLAVFHDLFHKTYAPVAERLPYWIAPLQESVAKPGFGKSLDLSDIIDWEVLRYVQDNPQIQWTEAMKPELLLDHFMYDDWNGKYRYFPIAIDYNLRPSYPPPYYAPSRRWDKDIMDWSLTLSKGGRSRFLNRCNWGQPVVQAEMISPRRNFLDKISEGEEWECPRCAICPQAVAISPVRTISDAYFYVFINLIKDRSLCQW